MNISIIGMLLTLLLVLVPLYFFHYFKVPLIRSTIISTVRMVVQMSLIGLYLEFLFSYNSWLVNVLWFVLMVLVASITAVNRTRMRMRLMLMPIAVGLGVGAFVVCMYALFVVLRLYNPFDARYFIPVVGILLGNMLGVNVLSLSTYYHGLQRERQLYFYLLGKLTSVVKHVSFNNVPFEDVFLAQSTFGIEYVYFRELTIGKDISRF